MKKITLLILSLFIVGMPAGAMAFESTYYVVRHAEKMDGDDPLLTAKGLRRAANIAAMLDGTPIARVYSTMTHRTIMTATVTAAAKGVAIEPFSTDDLATFAEQLKEQEGVFLIVAHSSSTPDLASLLSGVSIPKLDESDYEQMFKVTITDAEPVLEKMTTTFE